MSFIYRESQSYVNQPTGFSHLTPHFSSGANGAFPFLQMVLSKLFWMVHSSFFSKYFLVVIQGIASSEKLQFLILKNWIFLPQPVTGLKQRKPLSSVGPSLCWPVCLQGITAFLCYWSSILVSNASYNCAKIHQIKPVSSHWFSYGNF